jgi:hypothetical protein
MKRVAVLFLCIFVITSFALAKKVDKTLPQFELPVTTTDSDAWRQIGD